VASCPSCRRDDLDLLFSREQIARELELRERFFSARIDGYVAPADRKNRTDVARGRPAGIRRCAGCDILVRVEDEDVDFECDPYAPHVMEQMLRSNIDAFRQKERLYRPLLPDGARVIEVGSFVGAFLLMAKEWGWNAEGVDPGEDTSRFARGAGANVQTSTLDAANFDDASFDGVFIWNTFEQVDDASALLRECRRIARPGALLVLRIPNAHFYAEAASRLHSEWADQHHPLVALLGHANLLGFPHLYGFSTASIEAFVSRHGFGWRFMATAPHIPPSRSRFSVTARQEREQLAPALTKSWIEAAFSAI
jgi:SAM-dependent methyltransferase